MEEEFDEGDADRDDERPPFADGGLCRQTLRWCNDATRTTLTMASSARGGRGARRRRSRRSMTGSRRRRRAAAFEDADVAALTLSWRQCWVSRWTGGP